MIRFTLGILLGVVAAQIWGTDPWPQAVRHPDALRRAMLKQEANFAKAAHIDADSMGTFEQRLQNRRSAARETINLPEVVSASIERTAGGVQCKIGTKGPWNASNPDCEKMPVWIVIRLADVDGRQSSIWTASNNESKPLPVEGVEPY